MSTGKLQAGRVLCLYLLFYLWQFGFSYKICGSPKIIYANEGDTVTLQLDRSPITSVTWNFEVHLIATTRPGLPLQSEAHSSVYSGRLSSINDGSLMIKEFSRNDERVYRAELHTKSWAWICTQLYDLRITGNLRKPPHIEESTETCGPTIQLYRNLGEDVTLPVPSRSDLGFVQWDINNIDHIAITKIQGDGAVIAKQSISYRGRLQAKNDGSLQLLRVSPQDGKIYRAEVFEDGWTHLCVQLFDVRVEVALVEESTTTPVPVSAVASKVCGSPKIINANAGDDVTLKLDRSPITTVIWNFEKHLIATTKPGLPLQLEEHSAGYSGRLSSLNDGSLTIKEFSPNDEQVYRAELYTKSWGWICAQLYDLRITENLSKPPYIENTAETCGPTIQLYRNLREDVTLQVPSRSELGYVQWDINNIDHIAITKITGDKAVFSQQSISYRGRLQVKSDGSLQLLKVTPKDGNIYRADVFQNEWSHLCTQLFDVRMEVVSSSKICGSPKIVYANVGDDVTLKLDQSPITSVTWNFERHLIATTKPGLPLQLEEHSSGYSGRLSSPNDGSLMIRAFSPKDARVYRAELYTKSWEWICAQLYDLRIKGNVRNPPYIEDSARTCGPTIQLYHNLQEDVTLPVPSRSELGFAQWDINNIDHIAITKITGDRAFFSQQSINYRGRLQVQSDGSLQLLRVTPKDGNIYRADVFQNDWNHLCLQLFDVNIGQKGYLPMEERNAAFPPANYTLVNLIRLVLSGFVLLVAFVFLIHHIRTET